MNEGVLLLAILFNKGLITKREAVAIRDMLGREVISSNLAEMDLKVEKALGLNNDNRGRTHKPQEINAIDILNKGKTVAE